jgi:hypothetical protein
MELSHKMTTAQLAHRVGVSIFVVSVLSYHFLILFDCDSSLQVDELQASLRHAQQATNEQTLARERAERDLADTKQVMSYQTYSMTAYGDGICC